MLRLPQFPHAFSGSLVPIAPCFMAMHPLTIPQTESPTAMTPRVTNTTSLFSRPVISLKTQVNTLRVVARIVQIIKAWGRLKITARVWNPVLGLYALDKYSSYNTNHISIQIVDYAQGTHHPSRVLWYKNAMGGYQIERSAYHTKETCDGGG